jgi:LmbE family N-acetylglucosaminyl deacetylase
LAKILFLQPHPDDLELNCAHIMHYLATSKKKHDIIVASITKGEFGLPGQEYNKFKGTLLARVRTRELETALSLHGITPEKLTFFDYVDGFVPFNRDIVAKMTAYITAERPDIVFAPEPTYTYYPHNDHTNTGRVIFHVINKGDIGYTPKLYFYSSFSPNFFFGFSEDGMALTERLLACHKTQYWLLNRIKLVYKPMAAVFGKKARWKYAEPFRQVYLKKENARKNEPWIFARIMSYWFWRHLFFFYAQYPEEELERAKKEKTLAI